MLNNALGVAESATGVAAVTWTLPLIIAGAEFTINLNEKEVNFAIEKERINIASYMDMGTRFDLVQHLIITSANENVDISIDKGMHTDKRINLINGASNIDLKYEDLIESGVFYNNLLDVILNKIKKEDEDAYDLLDQSLNDDNYGKCIDENGMLIIDDKGYKKDISEDYEF